MRTPCLSSFGLSVLMPVAALVIAGTALAQDVKYEKYTLDNGLTVILHEDRSAPMAAVNLWYRVGAKEEARGRSGFAHLFEHLMFMGTERVPGNQFDILMETGGGSNNASTSLDRTNYFSSGPSSLLPTLLWLDADRLEDLGRAMTTEKLDKQRDIVRNELRQNVENRPYGNAEEQIFRYMYPLGHPYHEAVYGTHEDLEAADVHTVKDFFATFYVPNNCSLVVAGDFKSAEIKPLIAKLFGTIAKGSPVINREPKDWPVPRLGKVVRVTMLDKVELPRIGFTYHSPSQFKEGDAEMDLVASVLSQGKSSRLYKRLVLEEKLASDVTAAQYSAVLGSLFQIDVYASPDADLNRVEAIMDEEIARLLKDGVQSAELEQRKSTVELGKLSQLDSLLAKADKLNEYEYFYGEPNSFKRDLDRYRTATPERVTDWARKTLTKDSRLIMRVLPEAPERSESPRDAKPENAAVGDFVPAAPRTFTLSNGMQVMLFEKSELPLVAMSVLVHPSLPGSPLIDSKKAGLAELTAQMLEEGAGSRNAVEFADAVQSLGATITTGASIESLSVDMTVLKRNFEPAAALLADALIRPKMTEQDFERVKRLHLDDLQQALNEPQSVANNVGLRVYFGDEHPYARPVGGLTTTVSNVSLQDVRQLHACLFAPKNTSILISGDITVEQAKSTLDRLFADFKTAEAKHPAPPAATSAIPRSDMLRVVLVDRPDAPQTVIRFVLPGPKAADAERTTYRVLNTVLGGSFTSRLNANLREKNGYTYGAGSRFVMEPSAGMFIARSAVKADVTGPALKEFFNELERTRAGDISNEEATKASLTIRTEAIEELTGIHGPISAASRLMLAGLPYDTLAKDLSATARIGTTDLNGAAKAAIPLERGVLVLVGDKKLILEQIKDLKLPEPLEYTPEGEPAKQSVAH